MRRMKDNRLVRFRFSQNKYPFFFFFFLGWHSHCHSPSGRELGGGNAGRQNWNFPHLIRGGKKKWAAAEISIRRKRCDPGQPPPRWLPVQTRIFRLYLTVWGGELKNSAARSYFKKKKSLFCCFLWGLCCFHWVYWARFHTACFNVWLFSIHGVTQNQKVRGW